MRSRYRARPLMLAATIASTSGILRVMRRWSFAFPPAATAANASGPATSKMPLTTSLYTPSPLTATSNGRPAFAQPRANSRACPALRSLQAQTLRVHRVGTDCAKSITGYISGNLLISVICGGPMYVALKIMGVQFAGLIAIFVGFTDLIPLIGATIGAIVVAGRPSHAVVPNTITLGLESFQSGTVDQCQDPTSNRSWKNVLPATPPG